MSVRRTCRVLEATGSESNYLRRLRFDPKYSPLDDFVEIIARHRNNNVEARITGAVAAVARAAGIKRKGALDREDPCLFS